MIRRWIERWIQGTRETVLDELAQEEPLEIRLGGEPVTVTMRTPGHDPELAAGFLYSEGVISRPEQLRFARQEAPNVVNIGISPDAPVDLSALRRNVYTASSCGICGKTSIESVHRHVPALEASLCVSAEVLLDLPRRIESAQAAFARTGGLHAAALFTADGELLLAREDVGRHNAVDKVLGRALLNAWLPLERHILLVSGRASFEILQKALAGRIPIVAAVSAPSSLAVDFAVESQQTLIAFLRPGRMNIYTHPERIR